MISAISRAIGQLPDPAFRRVLLMSLGLTVLVFVLLTGAIWMAVGGVDLDTIGWLSWMPDFVIGILEWVLGGLYFAVTLLLFPAVASVFVSLFLDQIVRAVEDRHYPGEPRGPGLSLGASLGVALKFSLAVIGVNILALPFYLIPGINLVIYYLVNGHLLSREYFELVALGHVDPATAASLRSRNKTRVLMTGIVIAFLFTIPIVNFFAPVIAAAAMVHVFKGMTRQAGA